jgi:Zn-dependent protease/predicted transcriptional regulator
MRQGLRLGSISGIDVHVDWSLLIIFALVATTLATGLFPAWHPEWSAAQSWLTALTAAVLFFCSVLAHELSHSLVGRRFGIKVDRITLFVFGGMAQLAHEPGDWRGELWMAIVGPLTSLLIGVVCVSLASGAAADVTFDAENPEAWLARLGPLATLVMWLGQVNIVLALFNLVPGFPLDGGRVLRAIAWGVTGDLRRATRLASAAGQAFAWILIGIGLAMILGIRVPLFGTGAVAGLWLAFIGWFLNNAAVAGYRQLVMRDALHDVPVERVMQRDVAVVAPEIPVTRLVDEYLLRSPQQAFPVVENGRLAGLVTWHDAQKLERSAWERSTVRDIMTPAEKLTIIGPHDDVLEALSAVGTAGSAKETSHLPVVEQGKLLGLLRLQDVPRWLALHGGEDLVRTYPRGSRGSSRGSGRR